MKNKILCLLLLFSMYSAKAQYCVPSFNTLTSGYIRNFQVNTLQNFNSTYSSGYILYPQSAFTAYLTIGKTYPICIFSANLDKHAVWIDFNNDTIFSHNELIDSSDTQVPYSTVYFQIPDDTSLIGPKRLRVMSAGYYGTGAPSPCGTFSSGETEDYIINITDSSVSPVYCIPHSDAATPSSFRVEDFKFNTLLNCNSSANSQNYTLYDESEFTTTLELGKTYQIYIGCGTTAGISGGFAAWIDYNNDFEFENTENICWSSSNVYYLTETVTIPNDSTVIGKHRLRARSLWGGIPDDPCGGGSNTEAEDYTINIIAPIPDTTPVVIPEWEKLYNLSGSQGSYKMLEMYDRGFIVSGVDKTTVDNLKLVKLSIDGSVLWTKEFPSLYSYMPAGLATTNDGGFIIAGSTYEYDHAYGSAYVLKLNACGDEEWKKYYGIYGDYEYMTDIYQLQDKNYIVLGHYMGDGSNNERISLLKLDNLGNLIWNGNYTYNSTADANSFIPTSDKGFLITGITQASNICGLLVKVDSNGAIKWNSLIGNSLNTRCFAYASAELSDGFITLCSVVDVTNNCIPMLYKTDFNGNIKWSRKIITNPWINYDCRYISRINDNRFVIATSQNDDCIANDYSIGVFLIDSAATVLQKNIFGQGNTKASSLNITSDNKIIISGTNMVNSGDYKIYTVKLNTLLQIDSFYNVNLYYDSICDHLYRIEYPYLNKTDITVYPNPFIDYTYLNIDNYKNQSYSVSIMDAQGIILKKYDRCRSDKLKIDNTYLPSGIYFAVLKFEDGSIIAKKLIRCP